MYIFFWLYFGHFTNFWDVSRSTLEGYTSVFLMEAIYISDRSLKTLNVKKISSAMNEYFKVDEASKGCKKCVYNRPMYSISTIACRKKKTDHFWVNSALTIGKSTPNQALSMNNIQHGKRYMALQIKPGTLNCIVHVTVQVRALQMARNSHKTTHYRTEENKSDVQRMHHTECTCPLCYTVVQSITLNVGYCITLYTRCISITYTLYRLRSTIYYLTITKFFSCLPL